MKGYVWYSYGSDTTGPKLAEALKFRCGKKTPPFADFDLIVGWGCKPGEKYHPEILADKIGKREIRVLNHVDAVNENRNKLATLMKLQEAGVSIPGFASFDGGSTLLKEVLEALNSGELDFPILGLNEFHKGYPTFCYTVDDVVRACGSRKKKGSSLHYFRSFCPGTEFRIHVFRDTALAAEKKILAEDPLKQFGEHLLKKIKHRAQKEEVQLRATEKEIGWITNELAQDLLTGPSHMQRSVAHGWSLTDIPLGEVPDQVLVQAINAIDGSGLDMGAVSVVWDDDIARATGITSAPNLSEERLGLYVSSIQEFAKAEKPKKNVAKVETDEETAPRELIARLKRKIPGLSRRKAKEALKILGE